MHKTTGTRTIHLYSPGIHLSDRRWKMRENLRISIASRKTLGLGYCKASGKIQNKTDHSHFLTNWSIVFILRSTG